MFNHLKLLYNKKNKKIFALIFLIWFLTVLIGAVTININYKNNNSNDVGTFIKSSPFNAENATNMTFFVKNNMRYIFTTILGMFTLGVLTIFNIALEGFNFGIVIGLFYKLHLSFGNLFFSIVPHAVIEIPALLLSALVSLKGVSIFLEYLRTGKKDHVKNEVKEMFSITIVLCVLIFVAGIIEFKISGLILRR